MILSLVFEFNSFMTSFCNEIILNNSILLNEKYFWNQNIMDNHETGIFCNIPVNCTFLHPSTSLFISYTYCCCIDYILANLIACIL